MPWTENPLPVRITDDPYATNAVLIDKHDNCPHRQKDVLRLLKDRLPQDRCPNSAELQTINKVFKVADNSTFFWKPQFSSPQYSVAYVEWLVEQITADEAFAQSARVQLKGMNETPKPATPLVDGIAPDGPPVEPVPFGLRDQVDSAAGAGICLYPGHSSSQSEEELSTSPPHTLCWWRARELPRGRRMRALDDCKRGLAYHDDVGCMGRSRSARSGITPNRGRQ
jgi:hypothetical protein